MARDGNEVGWGSFVVQTKQRGFTLINCPDELVKKIVVPEILARLFWYSTNNYSISATTYTGLLYKNATATFLFFDVVDI